MILKILKSLHRNSAVFAFFVFTLLFSISFFFSRQFRTTTDLHLDDPPLLKIHKTILNSKSVLFPEWTVFNIVSDTLLENNESCYKCVFQNNDMSPALYAGTLAGRKTTFKCIMPASVRRLPKILTPALTKSDVNAEELVLDWHLKPQLPKWNWLVYDSVTTASDIVVFAKNVNRVGRVRSPASLRCLFIDSDRQFTSQVTSSDQEVFRCGHPSPSHLLQEGSTMSLTLQIIEEDGRELQVPSAATYVYRAPEMPTLRQPVTSSSLCACTMVYNVGKFLKEWVMYHSAIGVEKFVLYDNDSDDQITKIVIQELVDLGYNIETVFWPWPKAQEAGFSHSIISSNKSCKWMLFVDVDEFVFSPKWTDKTKPSTGMLQKLLPSLRSKKVGQVMIYCHDFGASNQTTHPRNGVTQGYTCRRKLEERHKSIVLLEAVDVSLQNSVHHFKIKSEGYKTMKLSAERAVVNHYKYQAWSEFKKKFKRRVSTYVVDWTENINLNAKDRAPGLGVEAIEPEGWVTKFCEVVDTRLQLLAQKWFGKKVQNQSRVKMAWET